MKYTLNIRTKLFSPQSSEKVIRTTKKGRRYAVCANNPFEHTRNKAVTNSAIRRVWGTEQRSVALPCRICLTRIGLRPLDFDNLVYSFKYIRDEVADLIIPGLARGRADGDKRIEWDYKQEIGQNGFRVEIEFDEPSYKDGKPLC